MTVWPILHSIPAVTSRMLLIIGSLHLIPHPIPIAPLHFIPKAIRGYLYAVYVIHNMIYTMFYVISIRGVSRTDERN